MVIPQLTHLGWDSADDDLASLVYVEGESFDVYLTATVSDRPGPGGDNFGITVISPEKLCEMAEQGPRFLRHYLLMTRFDLATVTYQIEKLCHSCPGADWNAADTKLSQYMHWEFESYREHEPRR